MSDNVTALTIGGETKVIGMGVAGQLFVFSPSQMNFLLNLQKLKNVTAAAISVGKDESWGSAFLKSRKFRKYLSCKMQEHSVKNGLTVEWWYQFGKWAAEGRKRDYRIECKECNYSGTMSEYEVEQYRGDDMTLVVTCPACFREVKAEEHEEGFKPTREQLVTWQELGARLIPKIERVHHQFEKSEIVFEAEGAD